MSTWKTRALTALDKSIAHWERMAAGTHAGDEEPTDDHCDCCAEFLPCMECPIRLRTGHLLCVGTPYEAAAKAFYDRFNGEPDYDQSALDAEVEYLRETRRMVESGELTGGEVE